MKTEIEKTEESKMTTKTEVVKAGNRASILSKLGGKYNVDPQKLLETLKATAFKIKSGTVTDEQMVSLLVVADQYDLNPFTREIFAFPDKQGGVVPVVGVDGWSRIINSPPQADGFEFTESEDTITPEDGKPCPAWIEVTIYRKDRTHPIKAKEYLDEVYRPAFKGQDGKKFFGPWQTHTKRFLRHKALIQGARLAFGFAGIYYEDEAGRIIEMQQTEKKAIEMPKKIESPKQEPQQAPVSEQKTAAKPKDGEMEDWMKGDEETEAGANG